MEYGSTQHKKVIWEEWDLKILGSIYKTTYKHETTQ